MTSTLIHFVLNFQSGQTETGSAHGVDAAESSLMPLAPAPELPGFPGLWLRLLFPIIPLPFGLDDCIWLIYLLTLGAL